MSTNSGIIVCSDKTGMARGTLKPVIFFERSDNYVVLPQYDAGKPEQARRVYELSFRHRRNKFGELEKWEWRETDGTLEGTNGVRALEKRLVEQERRRTEHMLEHHQMIREISRKAVTDSLYARMVASDTTPFERDAIRIWLDKREEKERDRVARAITNHNWYLWALHQNDSTKIEDRMPDQPGDFWRTPEQQRG